MQLNLKKPLIIAHRGASALAPENTLAAFQKAIDDGAEGIEFDVQLAKDGVPVVFHDYDLKRTGRREGKVSDFTSEELGNLDVGTWFNLKNPHRANEKFSAERVSTFSGLLDFLKDYKGLLYVEMKFAGNDISALVEAVCEIIRESAFLPQIKLKSFNLEAVKQAKKLFPEIRTVALFEPKLNTILRGKLHLIEKAEAHLADELSLHYSLATQKMMAKAKAKNFPVTIWTADNPAWVGRAINLGLDAIITNNPARLLSEKRKVKSEK
ncbi:MAG: glycerophosphodiester phosphodiesterase family protein [Pyrinomonadaceae bacterium]